MAKGRRRRRKRRRRRRRRRKRKRRRKRRRRRRHRPPAGTCRACRPFPIGIVDDDDCSPRSPEPQQPAQYLLPGIRLVLINPEAQAE
jgi:hypothetical protein